MSKTLSGLQRGQEKIKWQTSQQMKWLLFSKLSISRVYSSVNYQSFKTEEKIQQEKLQWSVGILFMAFQVEGNLDLVQ